MSTNSLSTALSDRLGLVVDFITETLSGASPWGTGSDSEGEPTLIMSGATIDESRQDVSGSLRLYRGRGSTAISAGYSQENDYSALSIGVEDEGHFNDKHTTLTGGVGISLDNLTPTDSGEGDTHSYRVDNEDKQSITGFFGVSQIINAETVVQTSINLTRHQGYLTDPYKMVDDRPDERNQLALGARVRHHLDVVDASVHADYRFYSDDWGVVSHTIDFAWYHNVTPDIQLIPGLRYYSQSQADFYEVSDNNRVPGEYHSSDYRLSPYGAFAPSLKLISRFGDWTFVALAEHYEADGSYALGSVAREHPALLSYNRITLGFDREF